ncbi:copper amine oxidase N-terminal domain-containing protein [Cohnella mopanensis]|uniref:copper amine oxidase N-terminal domain-containing protein n=1 Tax=Cohnella mopanensis TaxID=2911966 RepID=UPI001EF92A74|nr:copper amine oxidase N-terminal domain-containing protein [Cohnella mopanensis]
MKRGLFLITIMMSAVLANPLETRAAEPQSPTLKDTRVTINNERVLFQDSLPAVVKNGRIFVPIRIFEHSQIQGQYLTTKGRSEISIYNHNAQINMAIGEETYRYRQVDGNRDITSTRDLKGAPPYLQDQEAMIPLRPVAEALGIEVKWNNQTKSVALGTDEKYRSELDPEEEWVEWMGRKPIDWDDNSAKPITEEELKAYIKEKKLSISDYVISSKYEAVVLEVRESEASTYSVQRLRNGELGAEGMMIVVAPDEEGISVKRSHGYLSVVIYDNKKLHRINSCEISAYSEGKSKKLKFALDGGKQGYLLPLNEGITEGIMKLYGDEDYVYERKFW